MVTANAIFAPLARFLGTSFGRPQHSLHEPTGGFHGAASSHPESWSLSAQIPYPSSCDGLEFGTPGTAASSASRWHSQSRTDRRLSSHHEALCMSRSSRRSSENISSQPLLAQSLRATNPYNPPDAMPLRPVLPRRRPRPAPRPCQIRQCSSICRNPSPSRRRRRAQNNHLPNTSKASSSCFGSLAA